MKKELLIFLFAALLTCCNSSNEDKVSFYEISLPCPTNPNLACGSRIKPLFTETGKEKMIKESWVNKAGTIIGIVWQSSVSKDEKDQIMNPLFLNNEIAAQFIEDTEKKKEVSENFASAIAPTQKGDKWYKGMDVDQLSFEEAGIIADTSTLFAIKAGLIDEAEASSIKKDIGEYMKTELVQIRTAKELTSDKTDLTWKQQGYEVYVKYIGTERAQRVRDFYIDYVKRRMQKQK